MFMVMSTHGHREIEANKLKVLNVFKFRILNLMSFVIVIQL